MHARAEQRRAHAAIRGRAAPLPGPREAPAAKSRPRRRRLLRRAALCGIRSVRGGHNAPRPQAHPGPGAPAPARAPMPRPFSQSTGGPGAGKFICPGHTGISAVIPAALPSARAFFRGPSGGVSRTGRRFAAYAAFKGDMTPRARRCIRGPACLPPPVHPCPAHSPETQEGRVQAGLFVRAIPVFPPSFRRPCLQGPPACSPARLPHGKRAACFPRRPLA